MADKQINPSIQRCTTMDSLSIEGPELPKPNSESPTEQPRRISKSVSVDSGETEVFTKSVISASGSFRRRSIRRRCNKRLNRPEPEFGHDAETYKKIEERVLQERAVTNAIDTLQERWRMIMFMFNDCVKLNERKGERKLKKLSVQRQFELVLLVCVFVLICLPISAVFVLINR
ncbi:uncharacterized protein LOC123545305 [Mercenaria mercenaria]|uniref:uncharacterized protein LOC123545305 n=1 Tax=Mercenaria mercenaria TaxID=6596 RepID=UPI00234F7B58|nr:uncharacterized protein LOC123545305 [Mercenaria mercenaria]